MDNILHTVYTDRRGGRPRRLGPYAAYSDGGENGGDSIAMKVSMLKSLAMTVATAAEAHPSTRAVVTKAAEAAAAAAEDKNVGDGKSGWRGP
jgi:hypothetical protein